MSVQLFANGAASTLSGTLAQGGTTMTLASGAGSKFPSISGTDYFYITLFTKDSYAVEQNIEIAKVTARTGDTLTIVRDIENITGQSGGYAYDGNAATVYVQLRNTARTMGNLRDEAVASATSAVAAAIAAKAPSASPTFTGVTTVSGAMHGASVLMTDGVINMSAANHFRKTVSANTTFSVTNVPASGVFARFILELTNAGAYTITWWATINWGGPAPTFTVSGRDVLEIYTVDGGTTWTGLVRKGF